jgi:serpin B
MNRVVSINLALCCGLALLSPGCDSGSDKQTVDVAKSSAVRVTDPQVSATDSATLAADNEAFALAAYQRLAATNENLVFSPSSVSIALAITYAGAAGTTASEMASALHFTLPPERLHPAFDALDLALSARGEGKTGADGGPMRMHVVNSAWAERTYSFKSDYLDLLAANYGAAVNLLNFQGAPESARVTINDWVANQTEQKIKDLLPQGTIDALTRLVLVNAVYFNAAWLYPFDPANTADRSFTKLDNSTVTVKSMGDHFSSLPAMKGDGFSAVALPYQDDRLSLLLVVPDVGNFASFEASLDAAKLDSIVAGLTPQQVILDMPRFKVETDASFAEILQDLGMISAFLPGEADFSGMDGTQDLFITHVLHKAFIDVAEKGTEAAAATAVIMGVMGMPMGLSISADHPFLYFLRDQPTGAILFMGRVLDPGKN